MASVANRLARLETENPPSPRDGCGFCYDSTNDCVVLFGSQYLTDEKTYIYRIYKYGNPMKLVTLELIKEPAFTDDSAGGHGRYTVVAVGRS